MNLFGTEISPDATTARDYLRQNPRHLYSLYQDIGDRKLNYQPMQTPISMPTMDTNGAWNQGNQK